MNPPPLFLPATGVIPFLAFSAKVDIEFIV